MPEGRELALSHLFPRGEGTPFGIWQGVMVRGFSTDSRRTRAGDLFVGLPGSSTHGALYAAQALARGAAALVLPPGIAPPAGATGLWHARPFTALARAALRFYGNPSQEMTLVGVTGTNGKTTTSLLTAHLFASAGRSCSYWTTTLVRLPGVSFRPQWTTPPAHELQRFLAAARQRAETHAVVEVSSHAVRQERIAGVRFLAGIATNFSPDHLDYHASVEDYYDAKRSFIEGLPAGAAAVLPVDDPRVLAMGERATATVISFGESPQADVRILDLEQRDGRLGGVLEVCRHDLGLGRYRFELPMPGRHNAHNAAAAFAAVLSLGVPAPQAIQALTTFQAPPRRLEREDVGPYVIYNDVAMNEASYHAVLGTVRDLGPPQAVVVCALRGNRGPEVNARIAGILAAWEPQLHFGPLIVSESRSDLREYAVDYVVREDEIAAFRKAAAAGGLSLSTHQELPSAMEEAVSRLTPGGVLLLLGTFGMDRGPAIARTLLRRRLGLPDEREQGYLQPHEADY